MKEQLEQDRIFNAAHTLTNSEIERYYEEKRTFNNVYSRNSLPKIKDKAYVVNMLEYKSVGTHWRVLYVNDDNILSKALKNIKQWLLWS